MRNPEAERQAEERLAKAVRAAEQALIEYEIAVETFRVEVENFSRLHHQRLGPMYSRLDELDALIAEARAARTGDPEDVRKAKEARGLVLPMPGVEELFHGWIDSDGLSPEGVAMLTERPVQPPARVRPTEEIRKLYRELARQAHPDLAPDPTERKRREDFIVRVNKAYADGNEDLLRSLAEEWAAGPEPEPEEPTSEGSERLYARLEWLAQRKEMLAAVAAELESSAIGAMLTMAPDDPDALLEEIAEQLLAQVAEREAQLEQLLTVSEGFATNGEQSLGQSLGQYASSSPSWGGGGVPVEGSAGGGSAAGAADAASGGAEAGGVVSGGAGSGGGGAVGGDDARAGEDVWADGDGSGRGRA